MLTIEIKLFFFAIGKFFCVRIKKLSEMLLKARGGMNENGN